ncbi:fructuronate reductase [Enterococcus sp. PF1-24]|uniref:mannitol dehydrogenase family protein n=1 Tax=unclassified Enterococcus TaxID=2608891 RepID=UPI0024765B2C|nr:MULTISPECIES: mannitol dehydrogenase family protein [unclassified Enterococcus]MDH6363988.1 fructuronate reductase [Enterococcus sp. PFB1-1]MDH6401089.1 fructuronate reductase [Enterococcus sp. PF1-24]
MVSLDELEDLSIKRPKHSQKELQIQTEKKPQWVHFGGGNLYRAFHAEIAQTLIDQGVMKTGVIVCETFDEEIIEHAYHDFDNQILEVIMHENGNLEKKILNATSASYYCPPSKKENYEKVKEIFTNPSLQLVTVTITEKGYSLKDAQGELSAVIQGDINAGPDNVQHTMSIIASLLYSRFQAGMLPLALISTDNFSRNGQQFQTAILKIAKGWLEKGLVTENFINYLQDTDKITFPWSMIDRITPNPSQLVADRLAEEGIEGLTLIHTTKGTNIAAFANTEATHYLVIEDSFPNGRPALEEAGVILTNRETVDKADVMKVITCLNPLHTAMSIYGCLLGYTSIADEMKDEDIVKLIKGIGYIEGLPVVADPQIISPKAFIDEVLKLRLPNPMIPDTPQRIATDTSQKVAIRFGETIKKHLAIHGTATELKFIPLAIAGWLRYLLAIDDAGQPFAPSPDPLLAELQGKLRGIELGYTGNIQQRVSPILKNEQIFGIDLYAAGLGEQIEGYFTEMLKEAGAVRKVLHQVVNE